MRIFLNNKFGLNVSTQGGDIKWQEVPLTNIPALIEQGTIDAGLVLRLVSSQALGTGKFRAIFVTDDWEKHFGVKFIPGAAITYDDLLQKNPNAFKEYQRMIDESSRYAREHRNQVITAVAKKYDVSEKDLNVFMDWYEFNGRLTNKEVDAIVKFLDESKRIGILKEAAPPREKLFWRGIYE
jgi:ABC-type nitrate/sulfonate/bicarbonate transport system substrate-binding protein